MSKTQAELERYHAMRTRIQTEVDTYVRGARAQISRDLGIAPTTISSALNGSMILPKVLEKIDQWLADAASA